MITEHSLKKPDIRGLLLLDCWEPQVSDHFFKDKFYINLIEKIGKTKFLYIINSVDRLQIDLSDQCIANTMKICNYRNDHPLMHNLLQSSGNEKTSALISRYLFKENGHPINIVNIKDFVWFCTEYLSYQIQHWLVVGHTWQMCTHEHTLGLPRLAELSKKYPLNFYATDYSFCTMTEKTATLKDFEQDSMKWCQIQDFGYQLLPGI